jgi:four helix bundle protein
MISKEIAERARRFGCRIIELYEKLTRKGGAARALAPQMLDSGTSIGANLEEAAAGQTKRDFIAKVCIARKEARETVYWLKLLAESGLSDRSEVGWELDEAEQLVRILTAIVIKARSSDRR